MRLDKYLKVSRIIKRRTVAKELLDLDRVEINSRTAKPSSSVSEGDILRLKLKDRYLTIKIVKVLENAKIEQANEMYQIISEEYFDK